MATPPPPPNIYSYKGNSEGLVRAILEWTWAFYKATVLEDSFDTKQTTANAAAIADINATLDDVQVGTIVVSGTNTTGTAVVDFDDLAYVVVYGALSSAGTPAAGAFTVVSTNKTKTLITVTVQTAPGSGNSVTFDFIAKRP